MPVADVRARSRGSLTTLCGVLVAIALAACGGDSPGSDASARDAARPPEDASASREDAASEDAPSADAPGSDAPGTAGLRLTRRVAETSTLPYPLSSVSPSTHYLTTTPFMRAPDQRIYLLLDYDLAGATLAEQFELFLLQLNESRCASALTSDLAGAMAVPEGMRVEDVSGGAAALIEIAPPGGRAGGPMEHGYNLYDITDMPLVGARCEGDVASSIRFPPGNTYTLTWRYAGFGAYVRSVRVYLGSPG